jgi:hypothetical protein
MPALVQFDRKGKPTGLYYEQLSTLLLGLAQRQEKRLDRQAESNRRLTRRVDSLTREVRWLHRHAIKAR